MGNECPGFALTKASVGGIMLGMKPKPVTASEMGRRSQALQRERLGEKAYLDRQRRKGQRGGRPRLAPRSTKREVGTEKKP